MRAHINARLLTFAMRQAQSLGKEFVCVLRNVSWSSSFVEKHVTFILITPISCLHVSSWLSKVTWLMITRTLTTWWTIVLRLKEGLREMKGNQRSLDPQTSWL